MHTSMVVYKCGRKKKEMTCGHFGLYMFMEVNYYENDLSLVW